MPSPTSTRVIGLHLMAFSLMLTSAPIAHAQQIRTQPLEIIESAEPGAFSLRPGAWPTQSIPQDVVNPEVQSLADPLNSIPGVQARESGSPTISIRGSSQLDRVLQLYDGVPLNLADGFGASDLFLPKEILGSLQIVKGPASVFYGSSAMAGAIDHQTRFYERPAARVSLSDETGLLGKRSLFTVLPLRLQGGDAKAQFSALHEESPGRYAYTSVSGYGSGRREHNSIKLTRITGSGEFRAGGFTLHPRLIGAIASGETPDSLATPDPSSFERKGSLVSVDATRTFEAGSTLGIRVADIRLATDYDSSFGRSTSDSSRTSLTLDYSLSLGSSMRLRNFADVNRGEFSASYFSDSRFHDSRFEAGQAYDIELSPTLTLEPSFRYVAESGDFLKALALLSEYGRTRGWLTYSEGVRLPSLSDRFANESFYKGNKGLRAERAQMVELGAKLEPETRRGGYHEGFTAEASVFAIRFSELIDSQTLSPGVSTKINSGAARSSGAELSLGYSYRVWSAALSYGYLDALNVDTGRPLTLSPRQQGSLSLAQELGPIVMELGETFWSTYHDRDPMSGALRELPSWTTTDFSFHTVGLTDWEFKGGVQNIFDKPREFTIGFPEPQRRVHISALRYF